MNLPDNAKKIINLLERSGYSAYAVGGCVRDSLMGRTCGDIDIATSSGPRETENVLTAAGIRYAETGVKHGTVTAVIAHETYEITTFRTDGKYADNRHPDSVSFVGSINDDLARRDFTVNAMAYSDKGGIIDLYGGMDDISSGVIRCVGDADTRFNEDALRIMRALRFASVLGFTIEEKTAQSMIRNRKLLKRIAAERLFEEMKKLLVGINVEQVLLDFREVFAVIVPELEPSFDFAQYSKWHLYDVYTHTVKSVAVSPPVDYIRFALLLHDTGKPFTLKMDEKGDHFKGHPAVSRELAERVLKRFKVSNEFFTKVTTLIEIHDMHIHNNPPSVKRWLARLGKNLIFDFIDVKIADITTHNLHLAGKELDELYETKGLVKQIIDSGEPYRISDLCIDGNDLLALGYEGRGIACELQRLTDSVICNPSYNTREQLMDRAKRDKEKQ